MYFLLNPKILKEIYTEGFLYDAFLLFLSILLHIPSYLYVHVSGYGRGGVVP